jgi:hypothetical protein
LQAQRKSSVEDLRCHEDRGELVDLFDS